ncbi:MAG: hypothetical protein HKN91_02495 [Acidimicrobiia bacterium]|nr:hypothetical protein [Acidimicrobiia bacterium]
MERELPIEDSEQDPNNERGATLVLASAVLVVLIGMAGFSVDLGWLYSQRTEATKAAESAALAGVVHMPNPTSQAWGPGAEGFDIARDIAERKGYEHGVDAVVTPLQVAGFPNRLRVDVTRDVGTFFMRVFGVDTVQIDSTATAEQTPPLKIGSDEPRLGGLADNFFVAINGTRRGKGSGDPYSTKCLGTAHNCTSLENTIEYRDPAYYYAIEVPPSEVGTSLAVQIFDGPHNNSNAITEEYSGVDGAFDLSFRLFKPDSTPAEPTDNSEVVCSDTFHYETNAAQLNQWDTLTGCPVLAELGIYVLEVDIKEQLPNPGPSGNNRPVSAFAIRALSGGNPDNDLAVFGLGSMSLWMPKPGTNPVFKIVKLEEFYAGTELILSLFDAGDLNGTAILQITGELSGTECEVRIRRANGTIKSNWGSDDGGANCLLNVSNKEYNNEWIDLRFDIPSTYTCSSDCWVFVDFAFASDPFERTTWTATINGLPVHLVP